jgi:outer membrane protein OmpA-like peptidoglycan-associated protein
MKPIQGALVSKGLKRLVTLVLAFAFLLQGCTANTSNRRDTGRQAAGATLGGAAAGLSTAALGAPRPLVVGAALGGMALGYYVTTLRFDAGPIYKAGGQVYAQGEYIGVSIPSYKLFDTNTAEFLPQAEPLLDSAVAVLKRYPNSNVLVSGNTSGMSRNRYDQKLSEARARRVSAYLWAHGINIYKPQDLKTRKLAFVGYGNYFPIANSLSKSENIQKNSRIQITAYPSKEALADDKVTTAFNNIGSDADPDPEPASGEL